MRATAARTSRGRAKTSYERPEVTTDGKDCAGNQYIPKSLFQSWSEEAPTFMGKDLEDLKGSATWVTTTTLGLNSGPVAMNLLLQMKEAGEWDMLGKVWRPKFVFPGMVLEDVVGRRFWLILYPMAYGIVCWPLIIGTVGGQRWATVSRKEQAEPGIVHIASWGVGKVRVWTHQICSPLQYLVHRRGCDAERAAVCLLLDSEPVDCFRAMALAGFRGLTAEVLKDACAAMEISWDSSKPLVARVYSMLKAAFPDKPEDEILQLLQKRAPSVTESFLHMPGNLKGCEGVLELAKENMTKVGRETSVKEQAMIVAGKEKEALGGNGDDTLVTKEVHRTALVNASVPAAKRAKMADWQSCLASFVPQVAGSRVLPVVARRCFVGYYPRQRPPMSHTCSYRAVGDKGTPPEAAATRAFKRVWNAHHEATGEPCPIDWGNFSLPQDVMRKCLAA